MAQVEMTHYQAEQGHLPTVCMRCGEPAMVSRGNTFDHPHEGGIGLQSTLLGALTTKKTRLVAPFCDNHKNHWLWRKLVQYGGLAAILVIYLVRGLAVLDLAIALLAWFVAALTLRNTSIRPIRFTEYTITFTGVAEAFVQEFRLQRGTANNDSDGDE